MNYAVTHPDELRNLFHTTHQALVGVKERRGVKKLKKQGYKTYEEVRPYNRYDAPAARIESLTKDSPKGWSRNAYEYHVRGNPEQHILWNSRTGEIAIGPKRRDPLLPKELLNIMKG